ncbi:Phthalate dioxygenase reductase [Pelagimonas phthalicica]|uniref:Phthalate dioxygenase reductase n=2 Tax=Pelagimonas phthalicica TaxID=1037362 RepID=A0A238J5S7_9RHOB|nr:vanillate O-demethylase ferredoxin subunit [Pelagimonas phthalicica]SMX26008.1 Phthalate dioxygenase reductase [Pelagimonas phthalicica]
MFASLKFLHQKLGAPMQTMPARLISKTALSPDTSDFAFALLNGRCDGLEPGAHVDVHLGEGLTRQYSLWDWSDDQSVLHVAVKREDEGRGGSRAMHGLEVGAEVQLGGPRNHFALKPGKTFVTLIAGGIGATPLVAMARALRDEGRAFQVYYLARSMDLAAMDQEFHQLDLGDKYHPHCDDRDGMFDLQSVLSDLPEGSDVYTCGPEPMLNAVLDGSSLLKGGQVHFERFAAVENASEDENESFEVELRSTGAVYDVGPEDSILSVLQANDISVDFGCSEGLCGSCIVDVINGEVDHRDGILSSEEQATNSFMCTCVSRAKSARLVLDL